ncbi:hypothetical protein V865_006386 [Kwoniella europaea PYCC6329]|uniref:Zn(2)-C6 fungal-type domain-containing protein n=1 Tax=Kwoniella europaea PYCC6329 TaxID=1423913 RepID=A0AAX4KRV6_9TREE
MNNQLSLQNMQRHFSDTAYLPQVSSRLNPNPNLITRPSRGLPVGTVQQRGTMSMPTSPIMKKMVIQPTASPATDLGQEIWDFPQTAQAFFPSQYQQQQQHLQQQNNPHPGQTHNQAQSQDQIQLHNQNQTPNSEFNHHVLPMDLTPSSSEYYDTTSQPPTTSSLQYISPQSTRFQDQPPITVSGMDLGIGMDIDSPFTNHAGFPNQAVSPTINTQVQQDELEDHDMNCDAGTGADTGTGGRKKRIQVRIACTHCQKACKKCSNTRPCERCVKYGLTDCVDSTRKPRKTGIKRGPYKRRSSKYSATGYPYPLTDEGGDGDSPKTKTNNHQYQFPNQDTNTNTNINTVSNHSDVQAGFHLSKINHTRANFFHLPHTHTAHENHQSPQPGSGSGLQSNSNPLHHQPSSTHSQSIIYPPFPKPTPTASSNLVTAISNALSLPQQSQWVDGQRLPLNTNGVTLEEENGSEKGKTSPLYPKIPVGVFPFSLVGGKDDPFSRAVSPIKQFDFDFASAGKNANANANANDNRSGLSGVREESEGEEQNPPRSVSTSVSSILPLPNNTSTRSTNETITNTTNLRVNTQPMISSPLPMGPGTGAYTFFALSSKIRKPSLRTLMSTSTSRAPSPTATTRTQGTSNALYNIEMDIQSPTLFTACADDSGMLLDVDEIEGWNTPWSGKNDDGVGEGGDDDGIRNHDGGETGLFEGIMGLH